MRIEDREKIIIYLNEARLDIKKVIKILEENDKFTLELEEVIKRINEEIREVLGNEN